MEEQKEKRLSIDIDNAIHQEIKVRAALRNISIRGWIIQAIVEKIKNEDKYK